MQVVDANYMSRYAVVAGHTSHSYVESYYPTSTETAAFTFVREPVARWISGVWYYRKEQKMPILSREDALDVLVKKIEGTGKDTKKPTPSTCSPPLSSSRICPRRKMRR